MAISENKKASNARYMGKLDNIMVRPTKDEGAEIRAAAAAAEQSLQGYILQAIRERSGKKTNKTWRKIQLLF